MRYRRVRRAISCWVRNWLFEIGAAQVAVGLILWLLAKPWAPTEPAVILAMSASALWFTGFATMGVSATDDGTD